MAVRPANRRRAKERERFRERKRDSEKDRHTDRKERGGRVGEKLDTEVFIVNAFLQVSHWAFQ